LKSEFLALSEIQNSAGSATARKSLGSLFHTEDPAYENARSTNFARSRGSVSTTWNGGLTSRLDDVGQIRRVPDQHRYAGQVP